MTIWLPIKHLSTLAFYIQWAKVISQTSFYISTRHFGHPIFVLEKLYDHCMWFIIRITLAPEDVTSAIMVSISSHQALFEPLARRPEMELFLQQPQRVIVVHVWKEQYHKWYKYNPVSAWTFSYFFIKNFFKYNFFSFNLSIPIPLLPSFLLPHPFPKLIPPPSIPKRG